MFCNLHSTADCVISGFTFLCCVCLCLSCSKRACLASVLYWLWQRTYRRLCNYAGSPLDVSTPSSSTSPTLSPSSPPHPSRFTISLHQHSPRPCLHHVFTSTLFSLSSPSSPMSSSALSTPTSSPTLSTPTSSPTLSMPEISSQPLYPGANITVFEAHIMQFFNSIISPQQNLIPPTLYKLKRFFGRQTPRHSHKKICMTNVSVEISTADLVHLDITKSVEAVLSSKWCVVSGVCV